MRANLRRAGKDLTELKSAHSKVANIAAGGVRAAAPRVTGGMASTIRSSGTTRSAIVRAGSASRPYAGPNNWGWPAEQGGIAGTFGGNFWLNQGAKATENAWLAVYTGEVQKIANNI